MEKPDRIGKYEIGEFVGGGEWLVYRGRNAETGEAVIVRILSEDARVDRETRERLVEEARLAGIEDSGEDEAGRPYVVVKAPAQPELRIVARNPRRQSSRRAPALVAGFALALLLGAGAYFGRALLHRKQAPVAAPKSPATISTAAGDMVLVPAGAFPSGERKEPVWLPAFYIDKTEVTNAVYADFCRKGAHELPPDFPADRPDYPVVNVSMEDAREFAAWAGKRIPNAREWEKAARGEQGRTFPWGDEPDSTRANLALGQLVPAGAYPKGASLCGALQMIGNAWELVDEARNPTPEDTQFFGPRLRMAADERWYSMRGGAYDSAQLTPLLIWDSKPIPERWKAPDVGFRCVKDAK
jgi:formylglycine-generating enzyme required for sulfatase activity